MENPDGKRYTRIVSLLIEEFKTRFADFRREEQKIMLFTQPFCFDVQCTSDEIQLELLDLQANINLKEKFREVKLDEISKNVSILDLYKSYQLMHIHLFLNTQGGWQAYLGVLIPAKPSSPK